MIGKNILIVVLAVLLLASIAFGVQTYNQQQQLEQENERLEDRVFDLEKSPVTIDVESTEANYVGCVLTVNAKVDTNKVWDSNGKSLIQPCPQNERVAEIEQENEELRNQIESEETEFDNSSRPYASLVAGLYDDDQIRTFASSLYRTQKYICESSQDCSYNGYVARNGTVSADKGDYIVLNTPYEYIVYEIVENPDFASYENKSEYGTWYYDGPTKTKLKKSDKEFVWFSGDNAYNNQSVVARGGDD